ncbi:Coatomer, alpha subunit, partial [Baffinella frigidus]
DDDLGLGGEEGGGGGAGWDIDDLDLGDVSTDGGAPRSGGRGGASAGGFFAPPTLGTAAPLRWQQTSSVPGEHIAAGNFSAAMDMLNKQAGVVHFEPLKPLFVSVLSGAASVVMGTPGAPLFETYMHRNHEEHAWTPRGTEGLPAVCSTLGALTERIKSGYKAFTEGKLPEAHERFTYALQSVLAACVDSRTDLDEVRESMQICREYITAVLLEQTRRGEFADDPTRNSELAAYLTHCNLQPLHLLISLRSAMSSSVKLRNFNTAASFCRRLLELNPKAEHKEQALKVLRKCDEERSNAVELEYDERNPFVVCTRTFKPIYRGQPMVRCGFCSAPFAPSEKGKVCAICKVAEIGLKGSGLINSRHQRSRGQAKTFDDDGFGDE